MEERVMFYNVPLTHNVRCDGCGMAVGPERGQSIILEVREGAVTGRFHNKACYERTREKHQNQEI